jgi:hypothetical protein
MIDLSFAGLVGAMLGTIVAAIIYHLSIGNLERAVQARVRSLPEDERGDFNLSVVRRVVLTLDLLVFVALGYWLGSMFEA